MDPDTRFVLAGRDVSPETRGGLKGDVEQNERSYFTTRFRSDSRRDATWRHLTRYLARFVPPKAAVLELGAGHCHFINRVPASRRVAVDIGPQVREAAARGVEAHQSEALAFLTQAQPEQFDFILASNFFEHIEWKELNALIPLVLRVLRPGGRLAVIQPNFRLAPRRYFDDYTHRTIFTDVSLRDWLEAAGFDVVKLTPRFLPLTIKSRFGSLSSLIPLYLRLPWRPLAGQMFALAERPRRGEGSAG
jgi:SAM-dependent methyltransferase